MPRKNYRPSEPTSEWLLPQPSTEGVRRLMNLYRERTGMEVSEDDARDVLGRIMRFQYLNFLINTEGLPPKGPVPLGYRVHDDGRWEEDPRDGPLVRQAVEMRAAGASIRAVCAEMEAAGLRSRRGNAIGPSSMLKIL